MSIATVSASALAAVVFALLLTGCAATAPAANSSGDRAGEAWTSGGTRVVGGTARSVREADLRASRTRRGGTASTSRPDPSRAETRRAEPRRDERADLDGTSDGAALVAADLAAITMPVDGFSASRLRDTFTADRDGGARRHNAIDLGAPTGTPVLAAAPGTVRKIHTSTKGGLTVYVLGRDGRTVYYYAHLSRYADGLREGQRVRAGDRLGDVGASGNAQGAHLHFAIWRSPSADAFWSGTPLNPYLYLRSEGRGVRAAAEAPLPEAPASPVVVAEVPAAPTVVREDARSAPQPRTSSSRPDASRAAARTVPASPSVRRGGW